MIAHSRWVRMLGALALAAAAAVGNGCIPKRFVIDLDPASAELRESAVVSDAAAGPGSGKIALIHVSGFIVDARLPALVGTSPSPVDELVARLDKAAADGAVRAVVLRINSPGGTVTGSTIMGREVRRFVERTGKPVVASLGEIAASGGFYLAVAADRIIAEPTTVTGSIGVVIQTFNINDSLQLIGVNTRALTSGPNKDLANPLTEEREEHYQILQGMVDEFYGRFRGWVIERRPEFDAGRSTFALDGRVLTGAAAKEIGLVDEIGGVREAFGEAKRLAGIESARLITYHGPGTTARTAYSAEAPGGASGTGFSAGGAGGGVSEINLLQINAPGLLNTLGMGAGFYYLWVPPGG